MVKCSFPESLLVLLQTSIGAGTRVQLVSFLFYYVGISHSNMEGEKST